MQKFVQPEEKSPRGGSSAVQTLTSAILVGCALILMSIVAGLSFAFWFEQGTTPAEKWMFGVAAAVAEVAKALLLIRVSILWRKRLTIAACAGVLLFLLCAAVSVTSAVSLGAKMRFGNAAAQHSRQEQLGDAAAVLKDLMARQAALPRGQPAGEVQARRNAALSQTVRTSQGLKTVGAMSNQCQQPERLTAAICREVNSLLVELARAQEFDKLEGQIAAQRERVAGLRGQDGAGARDADFAVQVWVRLLGWARGAEPGQDVVLTALIVLMALMLEMASDWLIYIAWGSHDTGGNEGSEPPPPGSGPPRSGGAQSRSNGRPRLLLVPGFAAQVQPIGKTNDRPSVLPKPRIEEVRQEGPSAALNDLAAELSSASAMLGKSLPMRTVASLGSLMRLVDAYWSNHVEGHNLDPVDIERALADDFDVDEGCRKLQRETSAHVRVKTQTDRLAASGQLPEPASCAFIHWLHAELHHDGPAALNPEDDLQVGRVGTPPGEDVAALMAEFEDRYRFAGLGKAAQILSIPAAHHRLIRIHPFIEGTGRVTRLMTDVMCRRAGIGAHGLWSVSRASALGGGEDGRGEYKRMMAVAATPRQSDLDGRDGLSQRVPFTEWFLKVCLGEIRFMSGLFDRGTLAKRLKDVVESNEMLKPEGAHILIEVLDRGEVDRGEASRITGMPERSARRILNGLLAAGLLGSDTPKGPVSLRFPMSAHDVLFPGLLLTVRT